MNYAHARFGLYVRLTHFKGVRYVIASRRLLKPPNVLVRPYGLRTGLEIDAANLEPWDPADTPVIDKESHVAI